MIIMIAKTTEVMSMNIITMIEDQTSDMMLAYALRMCVYIYIYIYIYTYTCVYIYI